MIFINSALIWKKVYEQQKENQEKENQEKENIQSIDDELIEVIKND